MTICSQSLYERALTLWLMAGLREDKTSSLYFKDTMNIVQYIHMDRAAEYRLIRQLHGLEELRVSLERAGDVRNVIHFDAGFSVNQQIVTQSAVVINENGERYIHKNVLSFDDAEKQAVQHEIVTSSNKGMTSHIAERLAGYAALSIAAQIQSNKAILGDNKTVIRQFRDENYGQMYWHSRHANAEANFWAASHYA